MPQKMTEDDAASKICPFMATPHQEMYCVGSSCACWGWADGEMGELADFSDSPEEIVTICQPFQAKPSKPDGVRWILWKTEDSGKRAIWRRRRVKGPRRGQCEAMSPYIEVNCSD